MTEKQLKAEKQLSILDNAHASVLRLALEDQKLSHELWIAPHYCIALEALSVELFKLRILVDRMRLIGK